MRYNFDELFTHVQALVNNRLQLQGKAAELRLANS